MRGVVVGLGLLVGLLTAPHALDAQQTASVLVRVNVISVPVAPAAFDSLSQMMRDSVSAPTRARAIARARERGLRVSISGPSAALRPAVGGSSPALSASDVLLMEYVAN